MIAWMVVNGLGVAGEARTARRICFRPGVGDCCWGWVLVASVSLVNSGALSWSWAPGGGEAARLDGSVRHEKEQGGTRGLILSLISINSISSGCRKVDVPRLPISPVQHTTKPVEQSFRTCNHPSLLPCFT